MDRREPSHCDRANAGRRGLPCSRMTRRSAATASARAASRCGMRRDASSQRPWPAPSHSLRAVHATDSGRSPDATVTLGALSEVFRREVIGRQTPRHAIDTERELTLWLRYLGAGFEVNRLGLREWNAFVRQRASGEVDSTGAVVANLDERRPVGARAVGKSLKVLRHLCRFATLYRTRAGRFLLETDPTRGLEVPVESNPKRPRVDAERFTQLVAVAPRVHMTHADGERVPSYLPQLLTLAYHTGPPHLGDPGSQVVGLARGREATRRSVLARRTRQDRPRLAYTCPPGGPRVSGGPPARTAGPRRRASVPQRRDPRRPIDHHLATAWLYQAEKLAGLPRVAGGAWHPFRRAWATARKGLSLKDVAEAGGWKDTTTLLKCYTQADPETIADVVMHDAPVRAIRG